MAQIIISTIDSTNGSINATIKLKDEHLNRIFKAYKYLQAKNYIAEKRESGAILESFDTVEEISKKIPAEDVVLSFVDRLIKDMVSLTSQVELKILQEEFNNSTERIEWSL